MPYELSIIRICQAFNKLPHEVLEEDEDWLDLIAIALNAEGQKEKRETKKQEIRQKYMRH